MAKGAAPTEIPLITPGEATPMEEAASRSELAARYRQSNKSSKNDEEDHIEESPLTDASVPVESTATTTPPESAPTVLATGGTILEAAFVDPAYSWPPEDGQGKNAIELQASIKLLQSNDDNADDASIFTTESALERMRPPNAPRPRSIRSIWNCCKATETVISPEEMRRYEEQKALAAEARQAHLLSKADHIKQKEKAARKAAKYKTVPEGILIYRLDTQRGHLQLVSQTHALTDVNQIVEECIVTAAVPYGNKSRRTFQITDENGKTHLLTACEQRTATAWLEAMNLMHAKTNRGGFSLFRKSGTPKSQWTKENLKDSELNTIEDQYMNLANYSHKLIRAGALPGGKKGSGGAGGIYYSIDKVSPPTNGENDPIDPIEEEALEAIAKRRAVIKDSWDFYRMICSLLRDRNKYEEVFRRMQMDPVYPYLNSMTGLNDPGDVGYENLDKQVIQRDLPEYATMTKIQVAQALVRQAEFAMPSLVEICKALAGSLGMEEVGVGPVKDAGVAIRKAEKKYGGDLLKVTDYCRALLVVRDFPSLLALLELARDSFGPLITRVKMSTLKMDQKAKAGGYRDCIINVELKGHICEIQVHLWPMWVVCGVDGFRHYRHCVEYNTDSFDDAYDALDGLDRKTMAELIVMAEEAVAETPLDNLEWYHEKYILDYFAEAGLFMKHGLDVWAEITFRHLIRLRTESPEIGPAHHETIVLYKYLAQSLRAQNKHDEAKEVMKKVQTAEAVKNKEEKEAAEKSLWESFAEVYDMVVDPNRKEREEEQKYRAEVKQSKKQWRRIRHERFPFLDVDVDEKKVDESNP